MARILLGVSGGVAAYKSVELARLAARAGHAVRVVQTPSSLQFVGRASFEAVTGAPVLVDQFEADPARGAYPGEQPPAHAPISHLELVRRCDAFCVAPASANTIAKLANGHADNLLTTAYLACASPVLVAPAMNDHMYEHAATQSNLVLLRERGVHVIDPDTGPLASRGEWGPGRLRDPAEILRAIEHVSLAGAAGPLEGLRVLVTAGGTREPVDAVRYIGNRSSGRTGIALAEEAARRGGDVTLIAANVALPLPPGIEVVEVETASELAEATLGRMASADLLLMAAAVADFRPAEPAGGKISKEARQGLGIELVRTVDVLAEASKRRRPGQLLVGFAAEHGAGAVDRAREKLARKGADAIVVNDVAREGIGFDAGENEVTIVMRARADVSVSRRSKEDVARAVLDEVQALRASSASPADTVGGGHAGGRQP